MFRHALRLGAPRKMRPSAQQASDMNPMQLFSQVQMGLTPPPAAAKSFIMRHMRDELNKARISESRLMSMDPRGTSDVLRQLLFEKYLTVPFRVLALDMEFTGLPRFSADGPEEDIVEIGLYCPLRDETWSSYVLPVQAKMSEEAKKITGIDDEMLEEKGIPFSEAWTKALEFIHLVDESRHLIAESNQRVLLLSHGSKLADETMLQWTTKKHDMPLDSSTHFGDTLHLVRDLHRRRPVTPDKHPPSWKLEDLGQWLKIGDVEGRAHSAGHDAKLTWEVVSHSLERYGDEHLTPSQQLVSRFFDEAAKGKMMAHFDPSSVSASSMPVIEDDMMLH